MPFFLLDYGLEEVAFMQRTIYRRLLDWKDSIHRKPLVLRGARQVGKTYILKTFGENEFENMVVLNCNKDPRIAGIFDHGYRIERIISDIEILTGERIIPGRSLLFIDEIGDAPKALEALKYFCEDAPEYHVAVAGSLLGLAIHSGVSYPVGKTDELSLYPLSFPEFLLAKRGEPAYERLVKGDISDISVLSPVLVEDLREYYFTGGMPEVVQGLMDHRPMVELRDIQKRILADYALDISKHADSSILGRIHQIWNSIPQQLAKCNKKFIYGDIQRGARAKDFELAIQWLLDAGLVYKIPRVRKVGVPLKFYEDFSSFKLFLVDHGLMGAMVDAPISEILIKDNVFEEYKGTFTEQYVLEQLISCGSNVNFFDSETSKLEIDFMIQAEGHILPIEVKAEENLNSKSLRQIKMDYPDCLPVRTSMSPYRKEAWMVNVPLYAACRIPETRF